MTLLARVARRSTPAHAHTAPTPRGAGPATRNSAGLLGDTLRKAMTEEIEAELATRVRNQVRAQTWPGRLHTWRVGAEGRVFAAVQTVQALVWLDAGPAPAIDPDDPRVR